MIYQYDWDKHKTYHEALKLVRFFLKENQMPEPKFVPHEAPHTTNAWQSYGLYIYDWGAPKIYVNVPKATRPPKLRGRVWSYPGHKTDRTSAGILAHETGHHVSQIIGLKLFEERFPGREPGSLARILTLGRTEAWIRLWETTKAVTSYEPTAEEGLAETLRVFILNPNLLKEARRVRYEFIFQYVRPVVKYPWSMVLQNSPKFIYEAAQKFSEDK